MYAMETPQREAPDSEMLFGFWYRAAASDQIPRNGFRKAMLLEIPLVVGRDGEGIPFALRDACPHRGAAHAELLRHLCARDRAVPGGPQSSKDLNVKAHLIEGNLQPVPAISTLRAHPKT